jgi:hypothetical protein
MPADWPWIEILVNSVSAALIAILSAWVTVQLSLRKFRTEKWWERKADAYTNLIEALHHSLKFSDRHLEKEQQGETLDDDADRKLRREAMSADADIRRYIDVGQLHMSNATIQRLHTYMQDERKAGDTTSWNEYLMNTYQVNQKCLADLIVLAKKDLRVSD